MVDLIVEVAQALANVVARRFRKGPLRPGWSLRTEATVEVLRRILSKSKTAGIGWLRQSQARTPMLDPVRKRVRFDSLDAAGVPCLLCTPKESGAALPTRTLLYLHGGGYVIGSPDVYREMIGHLAEDVGARVFAPDYRLAPEHRFPAAQDDAIAVYRWLIAQGSNPAALALAGDSAGGGLVLATLLQARDAGDPLPAAAVLLCPWVDPGARGGSIDANDGIDFLDGELLESWFRTALGDADGMDPRYAPTHADLLALPPLLLQWGGAEVLCDQIRAFVEKARATGLDVTAHEWEHMFHDWMIADLAPEAEAARRQIADFLDGRLKR